MAPREAGEGEESFSARFVRLTAGLTRKEIAVALDLTESGVKKILDGKTQTLKAHGAIALARRLGVPVEYLADRDPLPAMPARSPQDRRSALAPLEHEAAPDKERDRERFATRADLAALRAELLGALRPIQKAFEAQADLLAEAERLANQPHPSTPLRPESGPRKTNAHHSSSGRRAK